MRNIRVELTNERIIPSGGLAVVGAILGKSDFVKNSIAWMLPKNAPSIRLRTAISF